MAVTIESTPQDYNTINNPTVFTFSSTNTTQDAFSFYVELKINYAVHSYHQIFAESGNVGKFDCSQILRTVLDSTLAPDGSLKVPISNAVLTYSIRVREKYGTPPTLQGSWYSSSTVNGYNGALRHTDWIDYDFREYDHTTQVDYPFKCLTLFPRAESYFCGMSESAFLGVICTDTSLDIKAKIYDVNDVLLASDTTAITMSEDFFLFDVSPQSLIDNTSIVLADFTGSYYYTIQFDADGGGVYNGRGEVFRIYIDNECTQYTSRRLHWLNKFGVFDSYTFNKYSETNTAVKFNRYEKDKGAWGTSDAWEYNRSNGQNTSNVKTSKDTMTLNSDWIKQDKQNWLMRSLLESPKVYLEISQGVFEPVIVATNKLTEKQRIREGLINEQIVIERTYNFTSQLN